MILSTFVAYFNKFTTMNKNIITALAALVTSAAFAQQNISISVTNPLAADRTDQPVVISLADYGEVRRAIVTCDGAEIPCQLDDLDQDEVYDELCFLADLKGKQRKNYSVELYYDQCDEPSKYPTRVFTEINLQHHHGVDFESELNGIRIYFDKRQTLDLYGKFQKRLELEATQFYTQPDQKSEGYGDDVLWVGNTFGLGAFRGWDGQQPTMIDPVSSRTQRIISYGPLRTIVELVDRGWRHSAGKPALNLTIRYIQYAGHRDTDVEVYFTKKHVDISRYQFSTGIIDVKGSTEFSDKKGLRGCWGSDFPTGDSINTKRETVGLGILIPQKNIVKEVAAGKDRNMSGGNYAFVVGTDSNVLKYKVTYTSANESFGYHSADDWFAYLRQWRHEVEHPVKITVAKR